MGVAELAFCACPLPAGRPRLGHEQGEAHTGSFWLEGPRKSGVSGKNRAFAWCMCMLRWAWVQLNAPLKNTEISVLHAGLPKKINRSPNGS